MQLAPQPSYHLNPSATCSSPDSMSKQSLTASMSLSNWSTTGSESLGLQGLHRALVANQTLMRFSAILPYLDNIRLIIRRAGYLNKYPMRTSE
jgi:hypothetical protein